MHSTLILDLDGTLLDTLDDLGNAMNHALSTLGLPPHSREAYRVMVGRGMRDFLTRAAAPAVLEKEVFEKALELFLNHYRNHQEETRPYSGIMDFLQEESEKRSLVVYTNKEQISTMGVLKKYFPRISFSAVLGHRDNVPLKPDPQALLDLMREKDWKKIDLCYLGDSEVDAETALRAGTRFIGVLWGFRTRAMLESAGVREFAHSVEEVKKLLDLPS